MALLAALALAACGPGAPGHLFEPMPSSGVERFAHACSAPPCPRETLACFHFEGTLLTEGRSIELDGWSEDTPRDGFKNNWHYILSSPAAGELMVFLEPSLGWVGSAAVIWPSGRGGVFGEAFVTEDGQRLWRLEMRPTDPVIAGKFAELAGSMEYRTQIFQSRLSNDGAAEILISEEVSQ